MPTLDQIHPSPRCFSRTSAEATDRDGLRTAWATVAAPVTVLPADLNGAQLVASGAGAIKGPDRTVTLYRSNAANQFSTAAITLVAKNFRGEQITQTVTPATDDGNDTLEFTTPVSEIVSLSLPAQAGVGGQFELGVKDLHAPAGQPFRQVRAGAAGNIGAVFVDGSTDTVPAAAGEHHDIAIKRLDAATTTAWPVTLYL